MLAALPFPVSPLGPPNRAMLLLDFGAALCCSELVGLCIGVVARVPGHGLTVVMQCSKTISMGVAASRHLGQPDGPPHLPVGALER